jgi:hypothetical protein
MYPAVTSNHRLQACATRPSAGWSDCGFIGGVS